MKKWDEVRVNTDIKKLTDLGIYKGYEGTIVEKKGANIRYGLIILKILENMLL